MCQGMGVDKGRDRNRAGAVRDHMVADRGGAVRDHMVGDRGGAVTTSITTRA